MTLSSLQQVKDEVYVNSFHKFSAPVAILIGGNGSSNDSFHGHITCFQLYDIALDSHMIKSTQLCPSEHGKQTWVLLFGLHITEYGNIRAGRHLAGVQSLSKIKKPSVYIYSI